MKRELTLADVIGYLPYRLHCIKPSGFINIWAGIKGFYYPDLPDNMGKPILRPMSDLYVEITERGYNDGKAFIPIFMMAKIKYPEFTRFTHCNSDSGTVFMSSPKSPAAWYEYDEEKLSIGEYDLVHRLHLDYRGLIPAGLAVSVHDLPTNPYECEN